MTQLHLLSGTVTDLKTETGYKNFIGSGAGRTATQAAAVGAAASGAFFNSGVLTTASMIKEGVTYYTCKVNGVTVSGYLNTVAFEEGDNVDFVVEYDRHNNNQALSYAVRKPNERKLWVMDRMGDGVNIMKQICWRFPLVCIAVLIPLFLLMAVISTYLEDGNINFLIENWLGFLLPICLVGGGGGYFIMVIILYISYMPKARIATKIIAALGYDNPEDESLAAISEDAKKAWEKENGKPFPVSDDLFVLYY